MTHLTKIYPHHFQRSLALSALALAIPWQAGQAATLNVDTTADNGALTACTATSGDCSLRGALVTAVSGDTINFDPSIAGQTIILGSVLTVNKNLTIDGGSNTITISGNNAVPIFTISAAGLSSVTITNLKLIQGINGGNGGGAIYIAGGSGIPALTVNLSNLTFDSNGNGTTGKGGAIFTEGDATNATVNIDSSVFTNNVVNNHGGAIYNYSGTMNITNSTFSGNTTTFSNGVGTINSAGLAGVTTNINNCTLVGNGGWDVVQGIAVMRNSIIQGSGNCGAPCICSATTSANNLTQDGSCGGNTASPLLGALANNGGSVQTMALGAGSPAIDAGNNATCTSTDARGIPRSQGGATCDIGAYELAVIYTMTLATNGAGTGTVSSTGTPTGTSCGANCLSYPSNTAVTLNATATNGSTFTVWNCTPAFTSGGPLTFNTTCTATFNAPAPIAHYHLSVQTAGTGTGNVTGAGSYPMGTAVTLVATPDAGSMFAGWSAGCSNNMTLTADTTCIATFNLGAPPPPPTPPSLPPLPDYLALFLQLDGTGTGKVTNDTGLSCQSSDCQRALDGTLTCNPQTCKQAVKTYSTVTLTPQADVGSTFSSWGGHPDCATGQFMMDSGKLCIAFFHLLDEPLTVTVQGQGHVTDTNLHCSDNCVVNYLYGTAVTLQASPATDWLFQAWSGDCNSTGQVLMTGPKTCGATFIPDPVTVDNDLDHITSAVEDAAPNHGDGNGDGIPDSQQNNVSSFVDLVSGKYLTLQVDKTCPIINVYSDFPEHYAGVNSNHKFLQGVTYFELSCATTQVTVYYHRVSKLYSNLKFYKYGPTVPGDMKTVGWYKYPATFAVVQIGGLPVLTATYTLTDGQLGDSTGVDGKIVDPAGIELE